MNPLLLLFFSEMNIRKFLTKHKLDELRTLVNEPRKKKEMKNNNAPPTPVQIQLQQWNLVKGVMLMLVLLNMILDCMLIHLEK